ncbi:AAA family ATPase [Vibrio parahaemolyticus]|uniref:AAA family ATPase n=1 Tax=Vibrio alginolyticus TaxID=663 RepID=UPI00186A7674|nr:AAA family ATPase [Vibrio parahaemolyticus]MBE3819714.1 AAA family ATPase [Vibrio parahaemolyticus]MBM5118925.1 AAA family ATPase [Vibrio parahaemolyticus]MBM5122348.1 AAA family ATPase [Vibrio parahaemolyticus]MBM5130623.1 AAA family ATPase [Vibrio parahaemolyticus]
MNEMTFDDLGAVAAHFRDKLDEKKYIVLFAYNGTGKTRLSMEFKELGRDGDSRDTLYFNAFTEDLFYWDNDLNSDSERVLRMNSDSRFFKGLQELEMENRIRPLLRRYADFDFFIDYDKWSINFVREVHDDNTVQTIENIKVSRGEENIFVWCFFLAVAQLAVDGQGAYSWVNYIYIDDPISSLDDNNAIAVASHLAQLLKDQGGDIRVVVSSHHALFFNVIWNELGEKRKQLQPYFLRSDKETGAYALRYTNSTPFFHHVALLTQLHQAAESGELYTYHFNILRGILEKTAAFHGFKNFSACIKQDDDDPDGVLHARIINILSHGDYSMFEPMEMQEENKGYFRKILSDFMENYRFNPELFPELTTETN